MNKELADKLRETLRGRPPKYKDPEELKEKAIEFLSDPANIPYTITGLTMHLGFCDRHSFYDMEKRPEFSHTIKSLRQAVENSYEQLLINGGGSGIIFGLKNLGWQDKSEVDSNVKLDTGTLADRLVGK